MNNICKLVKPIPLADSIIVSEIPDIPVAVFLIIGRSEYKTTTTIAGTLPIPRNGIIKPSKAILGIAWKTLANPNIGLFNFFI